MKNMNQRIAQKLNEELRKQLNLVEMKPIGEKEKARLKQEEDDQVVFTFFSKN